MVTMKSYIQGWGGSCNTSELRNCTFYCMSSGITVWCVAITLSVKRPDIYTLNSKHAGRRNRQRSKTHYLNVIQRRVATHKCLGRDTHLPPLCAVS